MARKTKRIEHTKPLARAKPISQAQQVRDVVASFPLDKKFVAADIIELLPHISRDAVRTTLLDMHDKAQLIRVKVGIYKRFK